MKKQRSQGILSQFYDFKEAITSLIFTVEGHHKVWIFLWQLLINVPSLVEKGAKPSELEGLSLRFQIHG